MSTSAATRLSVLGSLVVSLAAALTGTGCSAGADGASGDATNAETTETALSTHLVGLYESTTAGDVDWISFSEPNVYALARGDAECSGDDVPVTCASVGTYTIDAKAKTIALADARTGTTTTFPIAAVEPTPSTGAPVSLTTQDDGLVTGSGGSIVDNSGAPLVTPSGLSLTTSSGTQSLVSTPSDAGSCGGGSSSGGSASGGMCTAGSSGTQAHGHEPSVQAGGVMGAIGSACSNLALVCSLCSNLMNPLSPPAATDIMQTTFMQCTISNKKKN